MLRMREVTKSYGSVRALDALSLRVEPGEILGLLGPNGAGKSTTIALAVGLITPDAGRVAIEGVGPPTSRAARACMGVAPQSLAIYDELTARENLELLGALYGLSRSGRRARAGELLDLVGLDDRAADRVRAFSGGMKRRLNLAAALVHRPKLLLLDEPTAGVDPQSRLALLDIVRSVTSEAAAVLYTTHYMEEAEKLCDRVAIIDHGRLLALDTVEGLVRSRREHSQPTASRTEPSHAPADTPENASLERVYLELTGTRMRD
ncbi:MAG: ABC transporter ATP-binding protein [Planctomycetota bacterium]